MPSNSVSQPVPGHAARTRLSWRALRWVVAAALLLGVLMMFQDRLLYFPSRASLAEMTSGGLTPWPATGDLRGLLAEPDGAVRATAIVFHGNAGHAGQRGHFVDALRPLGVRVILAEYPGYGAREGTLGEASLVADAAHSIGLARRSFGAPLIVIGESLGAGVAASAVARQKDAVAGVLLLTPWDRLENVAAHHYPWLPVRWLLRDRYDSAAHLAAFGKPVAVALAEHDDIVPARFGQALYDALSPPRQRLLMAGAGHNDWPMRVDRAWWQQTMGFLLAPPTSP